MKRNILILVLLFASALPAFAQIENEIQQSKTEKISKGRAYLLEKFLDRDYDKVKEIKDYLMTLEDDYYVALWPSELYHILQWTKEYDALTSLLRGMDSAYFSAPDHIKYNNKVVPEYDDLYKQLYLRGLEDKHLLQFGLQEADLTPEDKACLAMFLDWLFVEKHYLVRDIQKDENQTRVNEMATQFLSDYPNSDYEWFVRHMIRKQYVENDWGWGMGLDICGGFLTGSLKDKFKPIIGFGISFDVLYKKFLLNLGYDIIISDTKIDQPYSGGIYPAGSRDNVMNFYANLGYRVVDNRAISIAPFVGIGGAWDTYGYGQYDKPNLSELDKFYTTYHAGLIFDIKTHGAFEDGVIRIKYNCGVAPINGSISTVQVISVGGTGIIRKNKRVY